MSNDHGSQLTVMSPDSLSLLMTRQHSDLEKKQQRRHKTGKVTKVASVGILQILGEKTKFFQIMPTTHPEPI